MSHQVAQGAHHLLPSSSNHATSHALEASHTPLPSLSGYALVGELASIHTATASKQCMKKNTTRTADTFSKISLKHTDSRVKPVVAGNMGEPRECPTTCEERRDAAAGRDGRYSRV